MTHAGQTVTIELADTTLRIISQHRRADDHRAPQRHRRGQQVQGLRNTHSLASRTVAAGWPVLPAARHPVAVHRSQSRALAALTSLARWRSAPPLSVILDGKIPSSSGRTRGVRAFPANQPNP
jgi:hypothetical protein